MMGWMTDDEGWHTHSFQFLQPHTRATIYRKHRHTLWLRKHSLKSITTNIDKMIIPQGVCRSAARSYLCRLASETRVKWNTAGPIFDSWRWRLLLTNESKGGGGGKVFRPHVETSKLADFNEDVNLKLIQLQPVLLFFCFFFVCWPFLHSLTLLQQHQQRTRRMKPFWRFVLACRGFAICETARAEVLYTCVASVRVQTCIRRSACAVNWRRRLAA